MKRILVILVLMITAMPVVFFQGYDLGAEHQQGLDAPGKAALITLAIDLYEKNDERAYMHLLSYLDTELSFYEEYLDGGMPLIAALTAHSYHIQKNDSYLQYVTDTISSTNDGGNKYRQDVSDRLKSINDKRHNKSVNSPGARDAPPGRLSH